MEDLATIRLELGINAQRIMSQFRTNNQQLDDVVTKGIERALKEILEQDNFEQIVCDMVKEQVDKTIRESVFEWQTKGKIQEAISNKIGEKISKYADKIAEKVTKDLK